MSGGFALGAQEIQVAGLVVLGAERVRHGWDDGSSLGVVLGSGSSVRIGA